jgi:hypothetical protein
MWGPSSGVAIIAPARPLPIPDSIFHLMATAQETHTEVPPTTTVLEVDESVSCISNFDYANCVGGNRLSFRGG